MTRKIYLTDSSITRKATHITGLGRDDQGRSWCSLKETIFHPQGGGQKADIGTIGGVPVIHVAHTENGNVKHFVSSIDDFSVGQDVGIEIDEAERFLNARYHTAGHLIAAIVEESFPGLHAVSGHHWPDQARVDFKFDTATNLTDEDRDTLERVLAETVKKGLPVSICGNPFTDRSITIGDFPGVPCGGTHVKHTGLLGHVKITKARKKGGLLRLSYSINDNSPC